MWISGESFQITDNVMTDQITYRDMTEFHFPGLDMTFIHNEDPHNEYIPNNKALRGPNIQLADIVAIGCSQTFGMGVQEEETWPSTLSRLTGLSYVNLAVPGSSPQSMVHAAISYVRDYGKPKYICANFPSLYRFTLPVRSDVFIYREPENKNRPPHTDVVNMNVLPTQAPSGYAQEYPNYSKKPHKVMEVIPYEVPLYLSMMAINHLIEFCNAAGIGLLFTTWYPETNDFLLEKKKRVESPGHQDNRLDMSGYVIPDDFMQFYVKSSEVLCHPDHPKGISWDVGTDIALHMGAHQHLHYAELFANKINALTQD